MTRAALQPIDIAQHFAVAAFCSWPIFNFLANNFAENIISNAVLLALATVYAPKAHGAWSVHRAFSAAPLLACTVFSSVASLIGGAGQTNYSAANVSLDALESYRQTHS